MNFSRLKTRKWQFGLLKLINLQKLFTNTSNYFLKKLDFDETGKIVFLITCRFSKQKMRIIQSIVFLLFSSSLKLTCPLVERIHVRTYLLPCEVSVSLAGEEELVGSSAALD